LTGGRPGSVRDLLAVRARELEVAVAVGFQAKPGFMNEAMVATAEEHKVGHARLAAMRPVLNVVTVHETTL
jgi:hypothetical protein